MKNKQQQSKQEESQAKKANKTLASKAKASKGEDVGEKRYGLRGSGSGSGNPSQEDEVTDFYALKFKDSKSRERYDKIFSGMPIKPGRVIKFRELKRNKFPYIENIKQLGWYDWLSMDREYYPNLVRAFYLNAKQQFNEDDCDDEKFIIHVNGGEILVDANMLESWFELPIEGLDRSMVNFDDNNVVDKKLIVSKSVMQLEDVHDRILHLIVTWVLRPLGGHYTTLEKEYLYFLFCIKKNLRLASFIVHDMLRIIKHSVKTIHYASVISAILEKLGVPLMNAERAKPSVKKYLDESSFKNCGFKYSIETDTWVRKDKKKAPVEGESSELKKPKGKGKKQAQGDEDVPNQAIMGYLDYMDTKMEGYMGFINQKFGEVQTTLGSLRDYIGALELDFHRQFPPPTPLIPTPPPSPPPSYHGSPNPSHHDDDDPMDS